MIMPDLRLHEPSSAGEASDLLRRLGASARVFAGGTDLVPDLKLGRVTGVEHLVSLRRVPGLRSVDEVEGGLRIGALVTPNALARDPRVRALLPALSEAAQVMASYPVRNVATVGGNIASAVPSSDLAPPLIAARAEAVLSAEGTRRVPLDGFFLAPRRTVREPHEVLTHLLVPAPPPRSGLSYRRFALREANALAVASVAAWLRLGAGGEIAEARLVLGAVAPIPDVARRAGGLLGGRPPSAALFAEAARAAREEARPIGDVRGSAGHRRELVEVLARRALAEAAARAGAPEG